MEARIVVVVGEDRGNAFLVHECLQVVPDDGFGFG
jgi:hypothetical protein